ncbi:MAG: hypothetical protein V4526_02210 [Patescibacteria group bacterium]
MRFRTFYKKTIAVFITASLILQSGLFLFTPQKVEAQLATLDAGNLVQSTISAIGDSISSVAEVASEYTSWSSNYKETILDPLAYAVAKTLLSSLTASVVEWINNGFEGSPSFLSNPGGFFQDLIGEEIGQFIAGTSDLAFLCSPFSINVRIALAFKYRPFKKKVSCTLDDIIKNATEAVAGASINGFTAGDFKQGRWPAFVSLTTEPQNNFYGAYLEAEAELDARLGNLTDRKKEQLNQGSGFLSYEKCRASTVESVNGQADGYGKGRLVTKQTPDGRTETQFCEIYTPGSVIAGGLQKSIGAPVDQLNLADEFNEIVSALFAQLLKQVITGGLKGVSGSGASDPNSYLRRLQNEDPSRILNKIVSEIKKNIDEVIKKETKFFEGKQQQFDLVNAKESNYIEVIKCFLSKAEEPGISEAQKTFILDKASSTEMIIITKIRPFKDPIEEELLTTEQNISILTTVKLEVDAATSSEALNETAFLYTDLRSSGLLHDSADLGTLASDEKKLGNELKDIKPTAVELMEDCNDL